MRFEAALFWIALPALLLWVLWLSRRSYAQLAPRSRWGSAAVRAVILAALLGALSRPVWLRTSHAQHVLFVVDASRSVTKGNVEAALGDIDHLAAEATKQGHRVSVIAFGRRPRLVIDSATSWSGWTTDQRDLLMHESVLPSLRTRLAQMITQNAGPAADKERAELAKHIDEIEEFRAGTIGEATDARAALRLALNAGEGAQGETRTVYLFTDANFNADSSPLSGWREAFAEAKSAGHTIHTVALSKPIGPEVATVELATPSSVRVNQGFAADLHVASTIDTPPDKPARIAVYRDGVASAEFAQALHAGDNTVHIPGLCFRDKGFHTIDAAVRVDPACDTRVENNRVRALVTVPGELRVLYVDSDEAHQSFLTSALSLEGVQVEARPAAGVPQSLDDLLGFDCFILANVPADRLGGRQMQMIRTYVQDFGGGFIMVGGDQSFGLGGYYGTPVEEVLPVRMPIQKDLNRPSIAIEILIDKSGSMEGPKMQLAKRAAVATAEAINPRDQIGVVAFDSDAREILPLTPAGDRATITAGIASLDAGGGTFLYPAMEIAHNTLQQSPARRKHCIIVSDGMTEGFGYADMAALMAADGITISTVGIGGDADMKMMQEIASAGAGRSYFTNDFNTIPQIFTREALRASNSMLVERLVLPTTAAEDESLSEVDSGQLPPLSGYVATTAKETAKVVIISDSGDPILARWRSGLGRAAAYTSDTKPHWAEDWIRWPDFAKFWAQLVRSCSGHEVAKDLSIESARRSEGAESNRLSLELRDPTGGFVNDKTLELTAFDPQSGPHPVAVEREAPGLFTAVVPQGDYGRTQQFAWKIMPAAGEGSGANRAPAADRGEPVTIPFGFVDSFSPELRTLGPDRAALDQIRELHAGDMAEVGEAKLHLSQRASIHEILLWPLLLVVALVLIPVDILLRRLG
jgi:Mg-chelatase subunit ChlD